MPAPGIPLGPEGPPRFDSLAEAVREFVDVACSARLLWRGYRGGLPPPLRELVMVAVSGVNACAGCTHVHNRWALRAGVSDRELAGLGLGDLAHLDARSRAAVVFVVDRAEHRFQGSPAPELELAAREQLTARELQEVEAVGRAMALVNRSVSTTIALKRSVSGGGSHPVFARVWARVASLVGTDEQRGELLAGLNGRVVEVGAGDGRNFAHYPSGVLEVVAVEPEPYLRGIATKAARRARIAVDVREGHADALPVADASCDAAVASLVLCSVADQATALAELRRALVPGGELRFFEHVVARGGPVAGLQRALDGSGIWPRLGAGCHLARDTVRAIEAAGFTVEGMRRFPSGPGPLGVPFVLGRARLDASS